MLDHKVPIVNFNGKIDRAFLYIELVSNNIYKKPSNFEQQYADFALKMTSIVEGLKNNLSQLIFSDSTKYHYATSVIKSFDQIRDSGEAVDLNATLEIEIPGHPNTKTAMSENTAKEIVNKIDEICAIPTIYCNFVALDILAENLDTYLRHNEDILHPPLCILSCY